MRADRQRACAPGAIELSPVTAHSLVVELGTLNVRRATEDDRETLYALWDEWVERESPVPSWVEGAGEGTRAGIDTAVSSGSAVIAEEHGEVLGFACGVMRGLRIGDLTELYVRPKARRRGIARELVRAMVAALSARGAAFVTGGVAPDNAAARSFYENAGFRSVELRLVADVETLERRLAGPRRSSQRSAP
jgi:ribosomal protein S18 acetylase RimI-like enzyme